MASVQQESEGKHFRQLQVSLSNVLESKGVGKQVHVSFQNVNAWVPITLGKQTMLPNWMETKKHVDYKYRQILYGIRGEVHPGEILALMGPSGSGKTSLISVLGGRAPEIVQYDGQIMFNGTHLSKNVKRNLGFVLQDDLLFPTLSVLETLTFAAYLRLPQDMSIEDKNSRVVDVIVALGLEQCKDTLIGGPFRRGVSGGERKRVSVGHELITNPSVLFLDEPTSGLDSTTALKLVDTLKDLSQGGRTILTTIHQPASRLYQQLDKLLLLCEGHVMYYGSANQVAAWFDHIKFPVPFGVNIADHILDLANGDAPNSELSKEEIKKHLIAAAEQYLEHRPQSGFVEQEDLQQIRVSLDESKGVETVKFNSTRNWKELNMMVEDGNDSDSSASKGMYEGSDLGQRMGAGYGLQLWVLLMRAFKTRRFEALGFEKLVQILLVAGVAGFLWWQAGDGTSLLTANDIAALLFFQGIFMSFFTLFGALFTFPPEFRLLLKERAIIEIMMERIGETWVISYCCVAYQASFLFFFLSHTSAALSEVTSQEECQPKQRRKECRERHVSSLSILLFQDRSGHTPNVSLPLCFCSHSLLDGGSQSGCWHLFRQLVGRYSDGSFGGICGFAFGSVRDGHQSRVNNRQRFYVDRDACWRLSSPRCALLDELGEVYILCILGVQLFVKITIQRQDVYRLR
eukprot:TRINITY_DN494_c0_g1_i3.p1 TRINITY_DN494_c0_g1~~TRINITY_DN494_c0_g1_i3.p1  ORF type:complete len:686 (-),score=55.92 TRINITY_DN494_c0_g1_i3:520-2577(-)